MTIFIELILIVAVVVVLLFLISKIPGIPGMDVHGVELIKWLLSTVVIVAGIFKVWPLL